MKYSDPPMVTAAGEYGATQVAVTRDGSAVRIAFGRRDGLKGDIFTGAVMLTDEAFESLKEQIEQLK